jgi:hypothetical protein
LGRFGGSSTATASASKKSVRAAEQDRPDVAAARMAWADDQPKLDPDRLVFIDETGTSTKIADNVQNLSHFQDCRLPLN